VVRIAEGGAVLSNFGWGRLLREVRILTIDAGFDAPPRIGDERDEVGERSRCG
jgi:hypothetical protein